MLPSKASFESCEAYLIEVGSPGFTVGRIHFSEEWGCGAYESESNFIGNAPSFELARASSNMTSHFCVNQASDVIYR